MLPCTNRRLRLGQYPRHAQEGEERGAKQDKIPERTQISKVRAQDALSTRWKYLRGDSVRQHFALFFLVCGRLSRLRPPWVDSCQPRQRAGLFPYPGTSGQTPALTQNPGSRVNTHTQQRRLVCICIEEPKSFPHLIVRLSCSAKM